MSVKEVSWTTSDELNNSVQTRLLVAGMAHWRVALPLEEPKTTEPVESVKPDATKARSVLAIVPKTATSKAGIVIELKMEELVGGVVELDRTKSTTALATKVGIELRNCRTTWLKWFRVPYMLGSCDMPLVEILGVPGKALSTSPL